MKIIAEDPLTRELLSKLEKYATLRTRVYLWGETGVGKDTFALYFHLSSGRRGKFLKVGPHNIHLELAEAQFFGYLKGAFSDAHRDMDGFLKRADRGTLYLDMLDSLPLAVQGKIFDALERGSFLPLGATMEERADFLLVASGSLPIGMAVERGKVDPRFLHLFPISLRIPPLRERKGDIIPLVQHFSRGRIKLGEKRALLSYPWPGNVRELRNFVEREISLGKTHTGVPEGEIFPVMPSEVIPLREMERIYARRVLERFGGNITRAARALGITRKTLRRLIKG